MKIKNLSLVALAALALASCGNNTPAPVEAEPVKIEPGEQAPLADPGQKNFGGMATGAPRDTTGMAARMKARMAEMNKIRTVHFNDLSMSDPFIYPDPVTKTYYLTSSGGRQYRSKDLVMWEGPYNVIDLSGTWCEKAGFAAAAEIHKIGDYYYYAGTWSDHSDLIQQVPRRYNVPHNQTYLLRADNPEGPFVPFSVTPGYDYQPHEWDCIDGTLYEEDGHIYMIFVHEWTQIIDGTMDYIELSKDLTETISEWPVTMFRASEDARLGDRRSADVPHADGQAGHALVHLGQGALPPGRVLLRVRQDFRPVGPGTGTVPREQLRPRHAVPHLRRRTPVCGAPRGGRRPPQAAVLDRRRFRRQAGAGQADHRTLNRVGLVIYLVS